MQSAVRVAVACQAPVAVASIERSTDGCAAVVERMREHHRRLDPVEAVRAERQRAPEWRRDREGMDGRADVVHEAGQRQRRRAHAAADRLRSASNTTTLQPGLRKDDGRRSARSGPEPMTTASTHAMMPDSRRAVRLLVLALALRARARARSISSRSSPRPMQFVPLLGEHGLEPVGRWVDERCRSALHRVSSISLPKDSAFRAAAWLGRRRCRALALSSAGRSG